MTLHVRVAGGWTGRLYSMCQEDAERLERKQSRHRIVQQQISDKLSPFQSMPMHLEKSVAVTGQDNPAFHEQESTSLPAISSEVAISIVSATENIRNTYKDLLPTEVAISFHFSSLLSTLFSEITLLMNADAYHAGWPIQWLGNARMELSPCSFYCRRNRCNTVRFSSPISGEQIPERDECLPTLPSILLHECSQFPG